MLHGLLASLLCASLAAPAGAVFMRTEMDKLDTEHLFDSEYFLDLLSFRQPLEWSWAWDAAPLGYRINGASLDRSDLWLDQEVKLPKRLNDWLAFDYRLENRGDKDLVEFHQWLAFDFGPWRGFGFGLVGEPTFDKQDADIGLRLRQAAGPATLRAGVLFPDFNFNERGTTGEAYARKPVTYTAGADLQTGTGRLSAALELDMPLIREVPASGRIYGYRRTRAALSWQRPSQGTTRGWRAAYAYEFKKEEDRFSPATLANLAAHRKVHIVEGAAEGAFNERDRWEAGALSMFRGGLTDTFLPGQKDARHKRWELQPYARWRRATRPWAVTETALFMSVGEDYRIFPGVGPDKRDSLVEAKLGLGVDFLPSKSGRIGFYGTFDLDDADRHIWDGGNVRAMFFF
ncbi:MAG: hypothetical protein HYZ75_19425 [Elusimicrobia bacterium]|nr:hypothetical protein [Elusimicrobiota bacterium]